MMIKHWSDLPERPVLPAGDCQVWLAWLDEEASCSYWGFLSEDERLRADRLRSPRSAERFTVTRGILRALLGHYLAFKPERLVFAYGPHGKPELAGDLQAGLSFNVSHSGGLAVFAVANGFEVGVDIEEVHAIDNLEATASILLAPDELAEFKAMPAAEKLERFFVVWTCKEAILKAIGSSFTNPAKSVLARFSQTEPKGDGQTDNFQNKQLILLDPAEGFKGALACWYPPLKE